MDPTQQEEVKQDNTQPEAVLPEVSPTGDASTEPVPTEQKASEAQNTLAISPEERGAKAADTRRANEQQMAESLKEATGLTLAEIDLNSPKFSSVRKPKTGSLLQLSMVSRGAKKFQAGYEDCKADKPYSHNEMGPGAMGYEAGWVFAQIEKVLGKSIVSH